MGFWALSYMDMPESLLPYHSAQVIAAQLTVMLLVGLVMVVIARRFRLPAYLGGLIAGVLLSGSMMGVYFPELHQKLFTGGFEQRQALERETKAYQADRIAYLKTGVTEIAVKSLDDEFALRQEKLLASIQNAERSHRQPMVIAMTWGLLPLLIFVIFRNTPVSADYVKGEDSHGVIRAGLLSIITSTVLVVICGYLLIHFRWFEPGIHDPLLWMISLVLICSVSNYPTLIHISKSTQGQERYLRRLSLFICLSVLVVLSAIGAACFAHAAGEAFGFIDLGYHLVVGVILTITVCSKLRALPPVVCILLAGLLIGGGIAAGPATLVLVLAVIGVYLARVYGVGDSMINQEEDDDPAVRILSLGGGQVLATLCEILFFVYVGSQTDIGQHLDWLLIMVLLIAMADFKSICMISVKPFSELPFADALVAAASSTVGGRMTIFVAWLLYSVHGIDQNILSNVTVAICLIAMCMVPCMRLMLKLEDE